MNWTEITARVPVKDSETAAAIANMTVPYGIYIEDYSDIEQAAQEIAHIDLIDEELIAKERDVAIIHIYISECDNPAEAMAFLKERLSAAGIAAEIGSVGVEDTDWSENWKKYFKPFTVGKRLAVVPSWEHYDNPEKRTVLQIDPGAAFGTGTHATTALCLELLEENVRRGDRVLDIGCGSGILSIAGVLLGAENAVGVDIDAQSVKTARENAAKNGVSEKTEYFVGDLADKVSGKYNVICANIVADVVIRLFESVKAFMAENAVLLVSGIIDLRAEDVLNAAEKHGFAVVSERTRENWYAFLLKNSEEK